MKTFYFIFGLLVGAAIACGSFLILLQVYILPLIDDLHQELLSQGIGGQLI